MHLADFLRERLNLTATHLRCEQGACGACTLLIDGQPARACITYTVLCDGAEITTLEGLENDPIITALRRCFSLEHGLQCGYCTPGMLITARDIVLRLPNADPARIRLELSGNLCRCTGYVGIVRAISRVFDERGRGELASPTLPPKRTGPRRSTTGPPRRQCNCLARGLERCFRVFGDRANRLRARLCMPVGDRQFDALHDPRQIDRECRALAGLALHSDIATHHAAEMPADGKTEAGNIIFLYKGTRIDGATQLG